MQQALEEIIALCIEEGFAYKKNVQGYQCGIHPENRAKSGVDPVDAQNLALKISQDGYTEAKLEITMCFEKAQAGTPAASAMGKNFEFSEGYLRNVPFQDAQYLPVTCSHTFAAP